MQKSSQFYLDKLNLFEDNEDYIEIFHELDRKKRPDIEYFESLGKKKFLKDFDLEGKRVMIRAHLKLGETPEAIIKKEGSIYLLFNFCLITILFFLSF